MLLLLYLVSCIFQARLPFKKVTTAYDSMTSILLDTDIGTDIDDAFALALALRAQNINLVGISTVSGDTTKRARLVKKMLEREGVDSIPIFAGKSSKMSLTHGQWADDTTPDGIRSSTEEMIDFYWDAIDSSKHEPLYIVAIGPLTNISLVRDRNPVLFDEKVNLHIMGGAIHKGYLGKLNILPEFNIYSDRKASRTIFESRARLSMVPLDVTMNLVLKKQHLESLKNQEDEDGLGGALVEMLEIFKKHRLGRRPVIMFDPGTVATLVDDSIAKFTKMPIKITKMGFTRVIKKPKNEAGEGAISKQVCLEFDKDLFFELFFKLLIQ